MTDDCSLFELAGLPVHLTQGDYVNLKITTKEDLPAAAQNKEKIQCALVMVMMFTAWWRAAS